MARLGCFRFSLIAIQLVSLLSMAQAAGAECLEKVWLDVPVSVVSDRKKPRIKDKFSKVGQDQDVGTQGFSLGQVHFAKFIKAIDTENLKRLEQLGCKSVSAAEAASINTRLSKGADNALVSGISSNLDANDGKTNIFETYKSMRLPDWFPNPTPSQKLVVFVHGCCIGEKAALERAATLLIETRQPVLMFDWATVGDPTGLPTAGYANYRRSGRAVEISEIMFRNMMLSLTESLASNRIVLVGHSMGNRIIVSTLRGWELRDRGRFAQVHLARPDLNIQAYLLDEYNLCDKSQQTFVYCAKNDKAIKLSEFLSFGIPRLGSPGLLNDLLANGASRAQKKVAAWFIDVSAQGEYPNNHNMPYQLISTIIANGIDQASAEFTLVPANSNSRLLHACAIKARKPACSEPSRLESGLKPEVTIELEVKESPFTVHGGDGGTVFKKVAVDKFVVYPGEEGQAALFFGAAGGRGGSVSDAEHKMIIELSRNFLKVRTRGFVGSIPYAELDAARLDAK